MSANYSPSRRGPRSQQGRRPSQNRSPRPAAATKAPKVGFFGKLLSLFGLGSNKTTAKKSSRPGSRPTASQEYPQKTRVSRKPEQIEVTSARLYVGNLSFDASESDLFELFSGIGQVQNVELVSHRDTHRSKGFGFIQMTALEEAKRAVMELHDKDYMGRKLVVSGARALPERVERTRETTPETEAPHVEKAAPETEAPETEAPCKDDCGCH
ncbi:MAG: RNA recognition motif domain-containing protein [Chthoniobacterales bacterium]